MSFRVKWKVQNRINSSKTTNFLLPLYGYNKSFYGNKFIDCYIHSIEDRQVMFVFERDLDEAATAQIHRLNLHHCFEESNYDGNDEIVVLMSIENTFHNDFDRFIDGKYSKFSTTYKDLIMKHHKRETGVEHKVTVFDVLYPTEKKAKEIADYLGVDIKEIPSELLDKPNLYYEKYQTLEQLKSNIESTLNQN